jgi:hypothetical protein|tara:strand:- start:2576 stop:2806 length:231 start_codon:yes stop_codon:yes gene_type:complete
MPISRVKGQSLEKNISLQGESFRFPIGTQANRPSPAKKGDLRYNADVDKTEIYNGTSWDVYNSQAISVALSIGLGG